LRKNPVELLTLSACQTAVGDERAALGLAGVAIKAGARSALASLWFVNDESTSKLVTEFYQQLQNPTLSKAQALQQAQKSLMEQGYQHPLYWAPFLLIGNWL
jgi:CHAT domain-containing protein